ncbi:MAG TPA: outer membrane lipoprotein carrier protein LolA [Nitrospirae bacterium]|nr:outer membrane lipoprotein carrier protein LolA [Nitrospirota bacterium]
MVILFLMASALLLPSPAAAPARLKEAYKGLKTLEGRFVQVSYIKDLGKEETFKGVFYLKVPDRMKWIYTEGSSDEVYLNGKEMVVYQPSEEQAFISEVGGYGLGSTPLSILLGLEELERNFHLKAGDGRILLRPKAARSLVDSVELVLSEEGFPVRRIRLLDSYGNSTELFLSDVKRNAAVEDSLFTFTPPPGTAVIRR